MPRQPFRRTLATPFPNVVRHGTARAARAPPALHPPAEPHAPAEPTKPTPFPFWRPLLAPRARDSRNGLCASPRWALVALSVLSGGAPSPCLRSAGPTWGEGGAPASHRRCLGKRELPARPLRSAPYSGNLGGEAKTAALRNLHSITLRSPGSSAFASSRFFFSYISDVPLLAPPRRPVLHQSPSTFVNRKSYRHSNRITLSSVQKALPRSRTPIDTLVPFLRT